MMNKKYTIFALVLMVLLVISGCTKNNNQKSDQTNNTQNNQEEQKIKDNGVEEIKPLSLKDVKEWKTFRNEKLGIEFNYPSQFGEIVLNYGMTEDDQILNFYFKDFLSITSRSNDFKDGGQKYVNHIISFDYVNNEYYINYITGAKKIIPKKVISKDVIFVDCMSYEEKCNLLGPSPALSYGSLAGVVNLKNKDINFKAISLLVRVEDVGEEVFIKILESIKLF